MNAARKPSLLLRLLVSLLTAVGTGFALIALMTAPTFLQLLAIGLGLIATGLILLLSTRLRASTSILSLLLLWSVVASLCLALRLGESSSFPAR